MQETFKVNAAISDFLALWERIEVTLRSQSRTESDLAVDEAYQKKGIGLS